MTMFGNTPWIDPRDYQAELDRISNIGTYTDRPVLPNRPKDIFDGKLTLEADPNGLAANTPGAKLDAGKVRPALVLGGFARALLEVSKVGTYGATKYTENGWMEVPNGLSRYDDAKLRHWLLEKTGVECDPDTNLVHAAHEAWNALARLDLLIRQKEKA